MSTFNEYYAYDTDLNIEITDISLNEMSDHLVVVGWDKTN